MSWRPETLAVAAGRGARQPGQPLNVPLVPASSFHGGQLNTYARKQGTPTWTALEEVVGALEGGPALAFASGMAAVATVLETLPVGARVVAPEVGYAGARTLLSEQPGRYDPVLVDVSDTAAVTAALEGAALLWVESPTNPLLDLADLGALAAACRERGVLMAVDNTLATPLRQRPLELGADIVVHSATKYLGGHSDLLLGVVVTRDEARLEHYRQRRTNAGAVPGSLEAFLTTRGIRTLPVRLARAEASAAALASKLKDHPRVDRVRYPDQGALLAFELKDGAEHAEAVCAAVRLISHATSLGGVETTIERRARYPGTSPRIPASLLRVSVGLEDPDDLWADLEHALS